MNFLWLLAFIALESPWFIGFCLYIVFSILNLVTVASIRSKQMTTVRLNHVNGNHEAIQKVDT